MELFASYFNFCKQRIVLRFLIHFMHSWHVKSVRTKKLDNKTCKKDVSHNCNLLKTDEFSIAIKIMFMKEICMKMNVWIVNFPFCSPEFGGLIYRQPILRKSHQRHTQNSVNKVYTISILLVYIRENIKKRIICLRYYVYISFPSFPFFSFSFSFF